MQRIFDSSIVPLPFRCRFTFSCDSCDRMQSIGKPQQLLMPQDGCWHALPALRSGNGPRAGRTAARSAGVPSGGPGRNLPRKSAPIRTQSGAPDTSGRTAGRMPALIQRQGVESDIPRSRADRRPWPWSLSGVAIWMSGWKRARRRTSSTVPTSSCRRAGFLRLRRSRNASGRPPRQWMTTSVLPSPSTCRVTSLTGQAGSCGRGGSSPARPGPAPARRRGPRETRAAVPRAASSSNSSLSTARGAVSVRSLTACAASAPASETSSRKRSATRLQDAPPFLEHQLRAVVTVAGTRLPVGVGSAHRRVLQDVHHPRTGRVPPDHGVRAMGTAREPHTRLPEQMRRPQARSALTGSARSPPRRPPEPAGRNPSAGGHRRG